ncbi:sigma-54-dependent transcriptional regulator [Chlorobium phaeovibrioides]|uniref:sigma-54-dependent transcriptional regulator n=1 Tax=Chlorobium phaeovibrioides TaxID=1094 RepID=UPI00123170D0|nr:sigma-54 dependent transcriptional regulator [Chlorobium phaeovibrioides]QEQ56909.1 sigma-54-dependent Fis family transcriptional regulator [Chlorobium phaeovibrioides]
MPPSHPQKTVLIADDSSVIRTLTVHLLKKLGYTALSAENGESCITSLEQHPVDLLMLDLNMPVKNGQEVLQWVKERGLDIPVIIVTALEDINQAVQCMKMGAYEYLTKPVENDRLETILRNALAESGLKEKVVALEKELMAKDIFWEVRGRSPALRQAVEEAMQVMGTDMNVLINGESGTGKELFAKAIHNGSRRKEGPFVIINCAAISNELADSLLFGHCKGSFTGAATDHAGYFEQADGGTIFLDEIGDMDIDIQAKILRALQEKKVRRVGEKKERSVDFRLISATHRDFSEAITGSTFRADLYYRLEEYPLFVPPLRERSEDIAILAEHFLKEFCKANDIAIPGIDASAMSLLEQHSWPGNIRELQNVIRRAVITLEGDEIKSFAIGKPASREEETRLKAAAVEAVQPEGEDVGKGKSDERPMLRDIELQAIVEAYRKCSGNQSRTATLLGISRSTLIRKMKRYGLTKSIAIMRTGHQ